MPVSPTKNALPLFVTCSAVSSHVQTELGTKGTSTAIQIQMNIKRKVG